LFDILYSAIHLFNGLQKAELPGLIMLTAPRGAARGRESDIVFGYFHTPNLASEAALKQQEWLKKITESFFKSPGTVTSGMRLVIEKLNSDLLTRNLDRSQEGGRTSGSLSLAVLHRGMLFYTSMGTMRSFVITKTESLDSQESEPPTRGLGVSQAIMPKFQQAEIHANDLVIFTPAAPLSWTSASLNGSADLSVEALRRRLANGVGPELTAALFRFVEGNGKALPLNLRFAQSETSTVEPTSQAPAQAPAVMAQNPSEPAAESEPAQAEVKPQPPEIAGMPEETVVEPSAQRAFDEAHAQMTSSSAEVP